LLLLIKKWTKAKGIANTQNSTISSYSWTLLVIHFLLVHRFNNTQPPILSFISEPQNELELDPPSRFDTENSPEVSLGQLFVQFFIYYGVSSPNIRDILKSILIFDPTKMFIQKPIPASGDDLLLSIPGLERIKCAPPSWRLSLIDPLDHSHDVGSCIQRCEGQAFIFNQLHEIVELFRSFVSQDLPLEDLLDKIFEINPNVVHLPKICSICFSEEHMSRQCPSATCFACGQTGHGSADCPNKICFKCRKRHIGDCPLPDDPIEDSVEEALLVQQFEGVRCSGQLLYETVLHWNINIITGGTLLPRNIRPIPFLFESTIEWFNTFFPFILEDLRCSMKGLIDNFDEEPTTLQPLIDVRQNGFDVIVTGNLMFDIKDAHERDFIENHVNGVGLFIHQYQKGNLLEALKSKNHFFVHIGFPDRRDPTKFECHFPNKSLLVELQRSNCSGWKFLLLGTHLSGVHRVCDALGKRIRPQFMKDILRGKVHQSEGQRPIGDLNTLANSPLNDSQNLAIERVLLVGLPDHPRIQVIKGPPGMS
jgi:hypothetical protein